MILIDVLPVISDVGEDSQVTQGGMAQLAANCLLAKCLLEEDGNTSHISYCLRLAWDSQRGWPELMLLRRVLRAHCAKYTMLS